MSEEVKKDSPEELWQDCLLWAREKDNDFKERCRVAGVNSEKLPLKELAALPLQPKPEPSASPFSRLTLPLSGVARLMNSTPYLVEEVDDWAQKSAFWLRSCGMTLASILLVADGLDGEGPGWGVLEGAKTMQTTVVSLSTSPWETVSECGASACALSAPLLDAWMNSGEGPGTCRTFFCLTAGASEEQRQAWQKYLGYPVYLQWGLPGLQASLVAWECPQGGGFHLPIDSFWPELIDSQTQELTAPGVAGELVLTALRRRSSPAIRMRTGWVGRFAEKTCRCGSPYPKFIPEEF